MPRYKAAPVNFPGYVSGNWYAPLGSQPVTGNSLTTNSIKLHPLLVYSTVIISQLGIRTTTAGTNAQLAIYAADPVAKKPTGPALGSTPSITISGAAGIYTGTLGANVTLNPGLYWLAYNGDNAATVCVASSSAVMSGLVGTGTAANICLAATSTSLGLSFAQVFNTWPDLTGQAFSDTGSYPLIFIKVA